MTGARPCSIWLPADVAARIERVRAAGHAFNMSRAAVDGIERALDVLDPPGLGLARRLRTYERGAAR